VAALLVCLAPAAANAQLAPYTQNFESMDALDTGVLAADGWRYYANIYQPDGVTYIRGYGGLAPNDGSGFCGVVQGQGGVDQGFQQLVVYSDYNNVGDQSSGNIIESNTYQEQLIGPADVGSSWVFAFQAKLGDIVAPSTAQAFIKTLDPNNNYNLTNNISLDMTNIPITWSGYTISIAIDASLEGQILQFGFSNRATNFVASAIYYDNVVFELDPGTGTPPSSAVRGNLLAQNYPNPFNPSTKIRFSLERPGMVSISIYDLAGRRVATLQEGEMESGEHSVVWNGRSDNGDPVASGQYRYVMKTAEGQVSRSMILLK
jgi:hypothetical protein